MDDDDRRQLALVIREHLRTRANPKEPIHVHALAEAMASHLKLDKDEVADTIVRHCKAVGAWMVLRNG